MVTTEAWIERAARLAPEHLAVESPEARLTYAQLERASWRVSQDLVSGGAVPGSRVALWSRAETMPTDPAVFAIALHACLRSGVVAVPIDPRLPDGVQAARATACDDVLLLDTLAPIEALAAALEPGERLGGWAAYRPGADERTPWQPPAHRDALPVAGAGEDAATAAALLYTSGSTGPGTPVLLTRGNLLWNALGSAAALGQPPEERWLSAMPLAHVGGLTVLTRSAIGATTAVLRSRFDAGEQADLLMRGAATITSVVPTMLGRMLDSGLARPPFLRRLLLGGGPIPPGLLERAASAGVPVSATYGMTEATSQVFTAGAPLFCTRVALGAEVGLGDPDEILVSGPTVAAGARAADGWLHTGDRGARTADGQLRVIGRLAETIITGGENVAPTEVEAALMTLRGIADAAVVGVTDPEWGERIEARVVLRAGAALSAEEILAALRPQLPPFAVPKAVEFVDRLPRTATGKLRRADLR